MEEKNEIKIKLSTLLLILAIIVIIAMAYFIYKLYDSKKESEKSIDDLKSKISNLESSQKLNNSNTQTSILNQDTEAQNSLTASTQDNTEEKTFTASIQNNTEEKNSTLSNNDDLVQKLYKYILKSDDFNYSFAAQNEVEPVSFYKKDKVTYSSLSDMEKTLIVLKNYNDNEVKSVDKSSLKDIIDTSDINDTVKVYENVNDKLFEIFNQNNSQWNNYVGCSGNLEYKNNNYYLSEFEGGGAGTGTFSYSQIQKAEKSGNYIYIYDKFIYLDAYAPGVSESEAKIYTTADEIDCIGTESNIWALDFKIENTYKKYENQLKTFKHTFQKTENGNYYWVSSEIYN